MNKVEVVYKIVFNIDITKFKDYADLNPIIKFRHKLVHEGEVKNKDFLRYYNAISLRAINTVSNIVEKTDYRLKNGKDKKSYPRYDKRFWNKVSKISNLETGEKMKFEEFDMKASKEKDSL